MKLKKLIAAILATAMVMTSSSFVTIAGAAELKDEDITVSQEAESPAETVTVEAEEPDAAEEVVAGDEAGDASLTDDASEADADAEDEEDAEAEDAEAEDAEEAVEAEDEESDSFAGEDAEEAVEAEEDGDEFMVRPDIVTPGFSETGGTLEYIDPGTPLPESVLLPKDVTTIPAGIFDLGSDCDSVKNIYFSDNKLELIEGSDVSGTGAFQGNTNLKHIGIGNVTDLAIGDDAFSGCTALDSIDLRNVTVFGQNALKETKIKKADLTNAELIGDGAFDSCGDLSNVTWGTGIEYIGPRAFYGCNLTSLALSSLTYAGLTIGDNAFAANNALETVNLPSQLVDLPTGIFMNCVKLNKVIFANVDTDNNLMQTVGSYAFKGCIALKEIEFGKNVKTVGGGAFEGCTALVKVTFHEPDGDVDIAENAIPVRNMPVGVIRSNGGDVTTNKVKKYADDRAGWKWEPIKMYPIHAYYDDKCGAVTPNVISAAAGQKIYLTVGPQNSYQLYEIRINGVPLIWEESLYKIVSTAQQIFVFDMPDEEVWITATFHSLTDMFGGGITWDFSPNYWAEADSTAVKFDESGDKTRINVYSAKTGLPIGPWALQFTTSNENIASVDEYGMITALKEGSATVSISNPIGTKRSITVYVKRSKKIAEIDFSEYFDRVNNEALPAEDRIMVEDASVLDPNSPYNDTGMYIIEFDVDAVARKDHTFNPELLAYAFLEDPDTHVMVDPPEVDYENPLLACTEWSPVDKTIATVQKAKTGLNTNLVTVKKGTYGDCLIEVKITNADKSVVRGGFIVRVRDTAPRMKNSSITLNVQQGEGTVVNCVPMYGYDVDEGTELVVCTKSYANGLPVYNPMGGFSAHVEQIPVLDEDGDQVIDEQTGLPVFDKVIKLSVEKDEVRFRPGTKVTFTGDIIRLYICGKQKRGTGTPVDFHMPINTVTVINELPKVQLSYVGKINLLYDETYENNETNCVKAMLNVSNIPDLKIEYVELMTTANYNLVEYFGPMPADDELNHNFQWDGTTLKNYLGSDIGFVIRVPDGIADDDQFEKNPTTNAIINSGVARIKFAGYENTTNVFVTVPCGYDFPRYTLSTARVSTSKYFENPYYRVQIINNGVNPKRSVQLYENEGDDPAVPGDALWEAENDYSLTGTKPGDFWNEPTVPSDFGEENREPERDAKGEEVKDPITNETIYNDFILLSGNGIPTNGKERILFKMNWWRKPMTFDFTMTMLASKATATTNPATATLTRYVPSQVARMNLKCNLADAEFDGIDFLEFKGNARTMGNAAAALMGNINFELADPAKKLPAAITASLDGLNLDDPEADDYIKNGSYAFTAKALLSFGGTALDIDDCPTVRFSIAVNGTMPRLTFKKPTFSLNTIYSGFGEVAECPITVTGLGAGVEYEIDDTMLNQIYLEHAAQNYPVGWKGDAVEYDRADKEYHLVNANGTWRQRFEFGVKEDDNGRKTILTVKFKNKLSAGSFNYSYYIYNIPIKTYVDDVEGTDLSFVSYMNRYRITIQGHERRDSVSFTAKGSFNQVIQEKIYPVSPTVDAEIAGAEMVYTAKISNLNGKIDKVKFAEVNIVTNKYYKTAGGENWSPHFELVELDPDKNTVTLKLRRAYIMGNKDEGVEPLASGRNHVLWIHYHIKERDGKEWDEDGAKWGSTQLSIQPRQVLPTLQNIITEDYLYAGGTIDKRTYAIKLGKLNNQTAMFCDAPANPFHDQTGNTDVIKIADNAPENIRRAFKVVQVAQDDWTDPDHRLWLTDNNGNAIVDNKGNKIPCGIVVIQLVQPSILVEGKIYNVPIEVRYVDQMKTVKGTIVSYPIMVVK